MSTESLSTPVTDFMRCCEVLLSPPVSRESLTQEELDIIHLYVESLNERFFA